MSVLCSQIDSLCAPLDRPDEQCPRRRAQAPRGAGRGARARGDADGEATLSHRRAGRGLGTSTHRPGNLRWRGACWQGPGRGRARAAARALRGRAALRRRARARLDRPATRGPAARRAEHDHVRLRVGGAPAPRQLSPREPGAHARRDPGRARCRLRSAARQARSLPRPQGGVLPLRLRAGHGGARAARARCFAPLCIVRTAPPTPSTWGARRTRCCRGCWVALPPGKAFRPSSSRERRSSARPWAPSGSPEWSCPRAPSTAGAWWPSRTPSSPQAAP